MASGCILGECPVCGDLVWEDEWDIIHDTILHERCKQNWYTQKYHLSKEQFNRLYAASELRKDIAELKNDLSEMHKAYQNQIKNLESALKNISRGGDS